MISKKEKNYYALTLLIKDPNDPSKTIEYYPKIKASGILLKPGKKETFLDHVEDKTEQLHLTHEEARLIRNDPEHGGLVRLNEYGHVPIEYVNPITIALYYEYDTFTEMVQNNPYGEADHGRLCLVRNAEDDPRIVFSGPLEWVIYRLTDPEHPHDPESFQIIMQKHDMDRWGRWEEFNGRPESSPEEIDELAIQRHAHEDLAMLDKFRESEEGELLYNGRRIIKRSEFQAVIVTEDERLSNVFEDDIAVLIRAFHEYEPVDESTVVHELPYTELEGNCDYQYENSDITEGPRIKTKHANSGKGFFKNCVNLVSYPWYDTTNMQDMSEFNKDCTSLIRIPGLMFNSCTNIQSFAEHTAIQRLESIYAPVAYNADNLAMNCSNLQVVDTVKLSLATSTKAMFKNCTSLEKIFDDIIIPQSKDITELFSNCGALKQVRKIDTPRVEIFDMAFKDCINLTSIGSIDMSHATSCTDIFTNCVKLMYVGIDNLNTTISFIGTKLSIESLRYIINHLKQNASGSIYINGTPAANDITAEDEAILDGTGWTIVR